MVSTRKTIRHTLRELLLEANTPAGDRIETNRSSRVWRGRLPAVIIYTLDDPAENFETAPLSYEHSLRVAIELWTTRSGVDEEDDKLDDLIEAVEEALLPRIPDIESAIGGNLGKSGYEGVQIDFDADGERILAGARLTLRFAYYAEIDYTPDEGLAPFTLAHVEYDLEAGDPIDAIDDIALPQ